MNKKTYVVLLFTNDENPVTVPFLKMNRKNRLVKHAAGGEFRKYLSLEYKPQHLYICSDEEIKEGDWYIYDKASVIQANGLVGFHDSVKDKCLKIIATTDNSLTFKKAERERNSAVDTSSSMAWHFPDYNLPLVPKAFIDYYMKQYNIGNVIAEALVEYDYNNERIGWINGRLSKDIFQWEGQKLREERELLLNSPSLKLNNNEIIIITSTKNSWTREEIEQERTRAFNIGVNYESLQRRGFSKEAEELKQMWINDQLNKEFIQL